MSVCDGKDQETNLLREMIDCMARALVDYPERVEVEEVAGRVTSLIELRVAKMDVGKVIGRHGATAEAMQTLLISVGKKIRKRAVLDIIDEGSDFGLPSSVELIHR